jgi:polyhydroxyalkanoate synthesis regulator phasin
MPDSGRKAADKAREKIKDIGSRIKSKSESMSEIQDEAEDFISLLVEKGKIAESETEDFRKQLKKLIS